MNDLAREFAAERPALRAAFDAVLESGWFVMGPRLERFERAWAAYCGAAEAIGVANGTDALEIALRAVGVRPGDEVVTVANAGGYATTAILACGARPAFADVESGSLNLDADAAQPLLARRPAAIVVTHLYGRLADARRLVALAGRHGVPVVEDCAQAHGARADGRVAGTFGRVGCYSFYPTKNLGALGDAGALVTNDPAIAACARQLRQYGWDRKYESTRPGGRNSRLDEVQAAFLEALLPGLDARNERRRAVARAYHHGIRHPAIDAQARDGPGDVVHLYVASTPYRDALAAHLARCGIASAVHYPVPDHRQPSLGGCYTSVDLPVTQKRAAEILSLPCHPSLADEEIARVVDACNRFRP